MTQEFNYRGYLIKAGSYEKEPGKWIPQATIISRYESRVEEPSPLAWPKEFDSQTKADSFALQGAQLYIDNHY